MTTIHFATTNKGKLDWLQRAVATEPALRKMKHILTILTLFLLTACQPQQAAEKKNDVYTRVMASGKIRCGYNDWPPVIQKDVNTGEFSGVGVDVMNEIAKRLKLTLSWDEETPPASTVESVKTGRVDMICFPIIITMPRIRLADFSEPVMFSRFYPWVKADSALTDADNMNDPRYRFVYLEGSAAHAMTEKLFPRAQPLSLVENSPTSDLFLNVTSGKADAVYADTSNALTYSKHNPGKIKPVRNPDTSLSLPWAFMTTQDNYRFVQMINLTLNDLRADGTLEKIIQKNHAEAYFTLDKKN